MKNTKKSSLIPIVVIGSILVIIILIAGTMWTGRSATKDNEAAVKSVSLFYLSELAGRRKQVVQTMLSDYISDTDVAIGLIEKDDLSSEEKLRSFQLKMKQLYGLEKFAFVDSDGLIYTSMGTRNDIDLYDFDPAEISGPEIFVKGLYESDKKLVIALPVDNLPYCGKQLVACFMEVDMDKALENASLQTENNGTTFCNIYTSEGVALTNVILGGLSSEDNLLSAMKNASYENGYSYELLEKDFTEGREGAVSFTYNGISETLYYVPLDNMDCMLTYLIRDSMISERISSISKDIISRSLILSIIAALALIGIFSFIIVQIKRNAKLTLEKEVSETENRVKQAELEEQLAMQEELLEQEQKRAEQDSMITALASDYRSVYYIDLDGNDGVCYRRDYTVDDGIPSTEHFNFTEAFTRYAERFVDESYRADFLSFIDPDAIRGRLSSEIIIAIRYLIHKNGTDSYEMLRIAGVRHPEDRNDKLVHAIGVGFTNIDSEMRESMERSQTLSDALKAAEEASKAKTVFLSNMSHEIRTPMNAIIGLDSLALNEKDLKPSTRGYLEKIGTSAEHLLSLINDILDMSRIESGRMSIRQEEFSFSKLIEQVNTIFNGQCTEKGLSYNCRINGQVDDYYIGDDIKLRQVLINILGNAVKFTPTGGSVDFIVEKTAAFDDKTTLRFTIRDTGIGMSKEYLPKLFETFSQENAMAGGKYGSSGLGMPITKSIVELMNGHIDVESEKGVGTTFTVTITLIDSDKKINEDETDIEIRPQDMTVLVVDDDPIACDHAKLVLNNAGIYTEVALSGQEAVKMVEVRQARRENYDLIIVDWKMPEMDGVETTRQIRSVIGNESAIIILTAYNWDDILDEAVSAGVDSFIAKPLFSGSLIDEFRLALKKKLLNRTAPKKADLTGKRILLAEDMPINAEIMISILALRDIETEHAENGKIAVELFESHPEGYYDAILMDMRMPEMNGLEAASAIRAMDRADAKTIPIIALTANAFDEDVQHSLQAGLNAHLSKPVQPEVLYETLENML
ncbi:MAG: response regulator [Lachnospiraceae bacterium]|nr:response regulator [Lachnospiraceae bacterium]